MSKPQQIVLNGSHALDVAVHRIQSVPLDTGVLYEQIIRPFKAPKTWKQIKTLHMLFNELSATDQNEWAGNTSKWWKSHYKIRIYAHILKERALEDENIEFLETLESLGNAWREASEANKPAIEKMITSSSEFSLGEAKKEDLIRFIDGILEDSPKKGIYLQIKSDPDE